MKQECRILVVDDDLSFRRLMEKEFKPQGFTVKTVEDGEKALEVLESFRPHIVILDLLLPKMDGFEVARRIKERPGFQSVHILMVTAVYLDSEDMKRAVRGGANGYYFKPDLVLTKPVHIKELREVVDSMRREEFDSKTESPKLKDTVLIIDDDEKNRKLLKMRLLSEDFVVKEAENGIEGLKLLEEELPNLVLLDVKMPGMSGIDLLNEIRQRDMEVPVIMMTAYGSESIAVDAFKKGADDYLIKPFDTQQAAKRIAALIERYSLKKSNEKLVERLKSISIDLISRLNTMEVQNLRLEEAYLRHKELSDFNQEFIRGEASRIQTSLWKIVSALCPAEGGTVPAQGCTIQKELFQDIASLMNVSRLTAIQARLCHPNLKKLDPLQEIESLLAVWRKPFDECGLKVRLDEASVSCEVIGDHQFFKELLVNLLSNCLTRIEGNGEIVLSVRKRQENGQAVSIHISDSGRLLEPAEYARLDLDSLGARAYRKGGEALKVSLSTYLTEILGWIFNVPNREGGGDKFSIDIPASLK